MKESDFISLLSKRYPAPAYSFLPHVRNQTGYSKSSERTADALAMSLYPSRGLHLSGFEIKCQIGDLINELKTPDKAEEIAQYCHYWWIVTPKDLIDPTELPSTWGLLEGNDVLKVKKKAILLEPKTLDTNLVCAILRKVTKLYIPVEQIEDKINIGVENKLVTDRYELSKLKSEVEKFEYNSGIKIRGYQRGNIGAAVKTVLDYQSQTGEDNLAQLVDYAENVYLKGRMLQDKFEKKRNKKI